MPSQVVGGVLIGGQPQVITQGIRKTSAIGTSPISRKVPQVDRELININAMMTPFLVLMEKLKNVRPVGGAVYNHLEKDFLPIEVTVDDDYTTETTFQLLSGQAAFVNIGTTLICMRTQEEFLVTDVDLGADTIDVTRAWGNASSGGGAAEANLSTGDVLTITGFSSEEGAEAPDSITSEPVFIQNACQHFRKAVKLAGRDISSEVYGPDEETRVLEDALDSFRMQQELAFLLSKGVVLTGTRTKTGGVQHFVTSNVTNLLGNVLTEPDWNDIGRAWLRRNFNSPNLTIMAGEKLRAALAGFGRDSVRYKAEDDVFGLACSSYTFDAGNNVKIIPHGLLSPLGTSQATGGTDATIASGGLEGYAFCLNMKDCGKRVFRDRGFKLRKNLPLTNGADAILHEYGEDCGFHLASERRQAIVAGIG